MRLIAALTLLGALAGTGCAFPPAGAPAAANTIRIATADIPQLDPHVVGYGMWLARAGLLEGLVTPDRGGGVRPATADRWTASPDGLTYTFHIRDLARWSDGTAVTAHDFAWTYRRLLTPKPVGIAMTAGAASYDSSLGIRNAAEYLGGRVRDWSQVGVAALDDRRLRLTLAEPNPEFLLGLTHPAMLPLPAAHLSRTPRDWQSAEHWVGNGPFTVRSWVPGARMRLEPNPHYWDRSAVRLDRVDLTLLPPGQDAGLKYENDEVDVVPLAAPDAERWQREPALRSRIRTVPAYQVAYLALLRSGNPALEDVRVREALSLAMDRDAIASTFPGGHPAPTLVPPTVPGWTPDLGVRRDLATARRMLTAAGHPGGRGLPKITILTSGPSPIADSLADTWRRDLGVEVAVDVAEPGVYASKRQALQDPGYVGFYLGFFSGLPSWRTWTGTFWGPRMVAQFSLGGADWGRYLAVQRDGGDPAATEQRLDALLAAAASPVAHRFGALVREAAASRDPAAASALYRQAARTREAGYTFLPVVYLDGMWGIRETVRGADPLPGSTFPFQLKELRVDPAGTGAGRR